MAITPISPLAPASSIGASAIWRIVPHVTVLLLLALSLTPVPFFNTLSLSSVAPPLACIGICFWSVRRPDRFGILAAFSFGLLQDLLTGAPPGLTAFCYALVQRVALRQHQLLQGLSFLLLWSGYGSLQIGLALIQWLIWSWLSPTLTMLPLGPFLLQACFGIILFPLIVWLLARVQAATVNAGRA